MISGKRDITIKKPAIKSEGKKSFKKTFKIGKKSKNDVLGRNPELDDICFTFEEMFEQLSEVVTTWRSLKAFARHDRFEKLLEASELRKDMMRQMHRNPPTDAEQKEYDAKVKLSPIL